MKTALSMAPKYAEDAVTPAIKTLKTPFALE